MDTKFSKPKGFGEILDHTFSLSKKRFKDFFFILLIFMGPVYLLQALILITSGTSFFRAVDSKGDWFTQFYTSFDDTAYTEDISLGASFGMILIGLVSIVLFPVAEAAVIFAVNHIRKNEEYTIGSVIKRAFSRFWSILGSSILYGLTVFGLIIVPLIIITIVGVFGSVFNPFVGIPLSILLALGAFVGIGYLLTRWSFYFGSVVLDQESPGFTRSWRLTRKRAWVSFGLYIVFFLLITAISTAVEATFGILLGNSVLLQLMVDLTTLFTTLLFSVGYAVMYLDLKVRYDAEDLDEMIDEYTAQN